MTTRLTLIAIASVLALSGCATSTISNEQLKSATSNKASAHVENFERSSQPVAAVREIDRPLVDFRRTEQPRIRGDVNLRAASAPFGPILSELGRAAGYTVAYAENVDINKRITVEFSDAMTDDAIRMTAFLAGYAAVIDRRNRTVMIADKATYTFRVPAGVFSQLQAQYNIGGNPANSGGGGQSASGTTLQAEFTVSGREGTNGEGFTKYLTDLAGPNSEVIVTDGGHISVRGNAQALRRVHDFMRGFVMDAMTQVEIEASVVEVALEKDFSMGIQWGRVIQNATSGVMIGASGTAAIAGALTGANPMALLEQVTAPGAGAGISAFRSSASTGSLITALSQFTDVNVVSQPKLVSMNNIPATFFDGTQLPYLGSVTQNGTGTETSVSGTVAFAIDGVSFSAIPSVVDGRTVQITLMPVLSSVNGMESFLNNTLSAPRQGNKQTYMRVLAETGKTLILGGIRYNKEVKQTSLPTSTRSQGTAKEVVILLRTNVIPAPQFDPIVSESL